MKTPQVSSFLICVHINRVFSYRGHQILQRALQAEAHGRARRHSGVHERPVLVVLESLSHSQDSRRLIPRTMQELLQAVLDASLAHPAFTECKNPDGGVVI